MPSEANIVVVGEGVELVAAITPAIFEAKGNGAVFNMPVEFFV